MATDKKLTRSAQNQQLNVKQRLNRLPWLQQLSKTQQCCMLLQPTVTLWCQQNMPATDTTTASFFNDVQVSDCQPNSNQPSTIHLSCATATLATRLKHQKTNLLKALQREQPSVKTLKISVSPSLLNPISGDNEQTLIKRHAVSNNSITSIEVTQKAVHNEALAATLGNLSETLRKR